MPGCPGPTNPHSFTGADYNGPRAPDLDRFIFSPVHYALVLYSLLIEVGRLGPDALDQFNQDGSTVELIGAEHSPGHEVTAGSLAQAISQAGGIALARRLRGEPGWIWVFMSDGEFQEGQTWEAFAALAHHRIGRLGVYVDANAQQCDGAMTSVMTIEPLAERLRAFGAEVHEVDGHDPDGPGRPRRGGPRPGPGPAPGGHRPHRSLPRHRSPARARPEAPLCALQGRGGVQRLPPGLLATLNGERPMMETVQRPHAGNLVRWAKDRPEVLVLSADLTASCEADGFRDAYPERFFSMGMAEQNMMGFAAGLAREGFFPYIHTFAVFICRRPFDQVAMSIAYSEPAGATHRLPARHHHRGRRHPPGHRRRRADAPPAQHDGTRVRRCHRGARSVLDVAQAVDGPVYVRMLRGEVPRLFDPGEPLQLGRARVLSTGSDLAVLSTGICTEEALRATAGPARRRARRRPPARLHPQALRPIR